MYPTRRLNAGFALVEVLVAILLLSLFLVAILPALLGTVLLGKQNGNVNLAALVAKEQVEALRDLYARNGTYFPVPNPAATTTYCALGQAACYPDLATAQANYPANTTVYLVRTVVTDGSVGCWLDSRQASLADNSNQLICYATKPLAEAVVGVGNAVRSHKRVMVGVYNNATPAANYLAPQVTNVLSGDSQTVATASSAGPLAVLTTEL
ncbi:type II secretion system protein [Anthocerotibacter panamensis]|uniref:type II secretion system protein n=1 Tax=Anthocerotibacter panamensis TaxID=2857077 RepID=UPI001C406C4B|nr:type II secretion system protein [Anthocerotibacter panamensis]